MLRPVSGSIEGDAQHLAASVPDNFAIGIGRVVSQWSNMEALLDAAIWRAAGLRNDLGRSVTSQMQVMGKLDLLQTILWQTRPNLAPQVEPMANYIKNCLQGPRNVITHGMWVSPYVLDGNTAGIIKFSARGRLTSQGRRFATPDELHDLALKIAEISIWLISFASLLPKLKQRRNGLGHKNPDPPNPQDCTNRRKLALQLPVRRLKATKAKPAPKKKRPQRRPAA